MFLSSVQPDDISLLNIPAFCSLLDGPLEVLSQYTCTDTFHRCTAAASVGAIYLEKPTAAAPPLKGHMQPHPFNTAHDYNPGNNKLGHCSLLTNYTVSAASSSRVSCREMSGDDPKPGSLPVVDLSKPRYDQTTYIGRAKHFFETVNPKNVFVSGRRLEEAAKLIRAYK